MRQQPLNATPLSQERAHWTARPCYVNWALAGTPRIVGGVGHVGARKGVDIFVAAARRMLDRLDGHMNTHFVWIGDGPELDAIRMKVRQAGLAGSVHFIGPRTNPYPYMNAFDVLLMTSRDDPFPRVNLECGILGVPVAAFEGSGGSKEFIGNDCGVLAPGFDREKLAEAAAALLLDAGRRMSMGGQAARNVRARYDISSVAPGVLEEVMALASGARGKLR